MHENWRKSIVYSAFFTSHWLSQKSDGKVFHKKCSGISEERHYLWSHPESVKQYTNE